MSTPERPTTSRSTRLANAFALSIIQVTIWPFAYFWMTLLGMSVAGCDGQCNYVVLDLTYNGVWLVFLLVAALTFAVLMIWQKRSRKLWPIAVSGYVLALLVAFTADRVISWALNVI
ncbi:hypothetical protein ACFUTX_09205 [Microbacterium sp. NPDC057407]|uniref:hypothetical protein n=1 Tax=Microbacterium sp. NPDC057407 TaxID=3346120 RepID=UPI00366BDAB1